MLYVEFTLGQSQEHFLSCHLNAFTFFGGCPQAVMVDYVPGHIIDLLFPAGLCAILVASA
jgi:transposase